MGKDHEVERLHRGVRRKRRDDRQRGREDQRLRIGDRRMAGEMDMGSTAGFLRARTLPRRTGTSRRNGSSKSHGTTRPARNHERLRPAIATATARRSRRMSPRRPEANCGKGRYLRAGEGGPERRQGRARARGRRPSGREGSLDVRSAGAIRRGRGGRGRRYRYIGRLPWDCLLVGGEQDHFMAATARSRLRRVHGLQGAGTPTIRDFIGPRGAELQPERGLRALLRTARARQSILPHDPFKALIAPRPIGWVSTIGRERRHESRALFVLQRRRATGRRCSPSRRTTSRIR